MIESMTDRSKIPDFFQRRTGHRKRPSRLDFTITKRLSGRVIVPVEKRFYSRNCLDNMRLSAKLNKLTSRSPKARDLPNSKSSTQSEGSIRGAGPINISKYFYLILEYIK